MKKSLSILATLIFCLTSLIGCGNQQSHGNKVLKVGATAVPHAEILEAVRPMLAENGIDLQIIEFSDYIQPNIALNDNELDANYFQHAPYLENFLAEHPELKLSNIGSIHIEPMGLYSKKIHSLAEITDGASIAIPNDPTNGVRSLLLLEKAGLIQLRDGSGIKATVQDITYNPKHIQFKEIEASQISHSLDDVTAAVINTNFAMQVNLVPTKDAIIREDNTSPFVNIVAVRAGDEDRPEIQALLRALKSDTIKQFIEEKYKGAVVPAF